MDHKGICVGKRGHCAQFGGSKEAKAIVRLGEIPNLVDLLQPKAQQIPQLLENRHNSLQVGLKHDLQGQTVTEVETARHTLQDRQFNRQRDFNATAAASC